MLLLQRKMGPKKGRRVRKMEERGEGGGAREREEEAQQQREEGTRKETTHSAEEGVAEKHARTVRSDTEMETEGGREAGTSQLYITNIYLMDY